MNNFTVKNNQNLLDISLQSSGSIEALFDIAKQNNIDSVTQEFEGIELVNNTVLNESIVQELQGNNKPATSGTFIPVDSQNSLMNQIILLTEKESITVTNNQSLFDIALQTTGKIDSVFDIAKINSFNSIVSNITDLKIIKPIIIDNKVVKQLQGNNKPATAGIYTGSLNGEYEVEEYNNEEYNI